MIRLHLLTISLLYTIGLGLISDTICAEQCLDQAIVIVNDSIITERDVERHLVELQKQPGALEASNAINGSNSDHRPDRKTVLNSLINNELTLQKANVVAENISDAQFHQLIADIPQEMLAQLPEDKEQAKLTLISQQLMFEALNRYNNKPTEAEIEEQSKNLPAYPAEISPVEYHIADIVFDSTKQTKTDKASSNFFTNLWRGVSKNFSLFNNRQIQERLIESKQADPFKREASQLSEPMILKKQTLVKDKAQIKDLLWRPVNRLPAPYVEAIEKLKPKTGDIIGPFKSFNQLHYIHFLGKRGEELITRARHILIASDTADDAAVEKKLKNIRIACLKQKNFEVQAKKHSEDPDTLFKGGDLGWIMPGTRSPTFEKQLHRLKLGEISMPFKTSKGWHIVQVIDRETLTPHHPMFKKYFAQNIISRKKMMEALEAWQKELRSQAYIKWLEAESDFPEKA